MNVILECLYISVTSWERTGNGKKCRWLWTWRTWNAISCVSLGHARVKVTPVTRSALQCPETHRLNGVTDPRAAAQAEGQRVKRREKGPWWALMNCRPSREKSSPASRVNSRNLRARWRLRRVATPAAVPSIPHPCLPLPRIWPLNYIRLIYTPNYDNATHSRNYVIYLALNPKK